MASLGHRVHIAFLSEAKDVGRGLDYENSFLNDLEQAGIAYSFIGHDTRRNPVLGGLRLRRLVSEVNADIVHCHLYYSVLFSFFIGGGEVVYTHHNIVLKVPSYLYRIFDFKVSSYVGICNACTEMLGKVTKKNVIRIDNAVDRNKIIPAKLGVSDTIKILMVGGLSEQKNYPLVIKSLSYLSDLEFRLTIAGEGGEYPALIRLVEQLGLSEKVFFIGNSDKVPDLLANSDIFSMSSSWEGLPIALIEATLTGLPVVVTNVGGCAEVVHACQNGIVVDANDPEMYASALRAVIESKDLRTFYSMNAFKHSHLYEIESAVRKHIELYHSLIDAK